MKRLIWSLLFLPLFAFGSAKASLVFFIVKAENGALVLRNNISGVAASKKNLELGESVDGGVATLQGPGSRELEVEYQLETTLGISDEGPHFDLHDWKHSVSDWKPLEKKSPGVFLFPKDLNWKEFPRVSTSEITEAVKKFGGEPKWVELSKKCASPTEYPCHVGVSQIRIRILKKGTPIHTTTLVTPMGC